MRILFLDDDPGRRELFWHLAQKKYQGEQTLEIWLVKTAAEAIELLKKHSFDQVYLDYDLADAHYLDLEGNHKGTGMDVVAWLIAAHDHPEGEECPADAPLFVVHSWNPSAGPKMHDLLKAAGLKVVRKEFGMGVVQ